MKLLYLCIHQKAYFQLYDLQFREQKNLQKKLGTV